MKQETKTKHLVNVEGIIMAESDIKMLNGGIRILTVPVFFENHGTVFCSFFNNKIEKLMSDFEDNNYNLKDLRYFFTGEIKEILGSNYKTMIVNNF